MKVVDFIVCDDIRSEVGNKFSLMGTFADRILIRDEVSWPVQMVLGIFARVALEPGEAEPEQFIMTVLSDGKDVARAAGDVAPPKTRLLSFVVGFRPLVIPSPGLLVFKFDVLREGKPAIESYVFNMQVVPFAATTPTAP